MEDMTGSQKTYPRVLSIAGSDPSGGAGIQADIKSCSANGVYAATAITAVVDENTVGVTAVHPVPDEFVAGQIRSVLGDVGAGAVKIGMLHSASLVRIVRHTLDEFPEIGNIVLDPVMVATSGDLLLEPDAVAALCDSLIPRATVITPNMPEAEILLGRKIDACEELSGAACELASRFPGVAVYLKGGHRQDNVVEDVLVLSPGVRPLVFRSQRIDTVNTHGTGCTLSSAIASHLALGKDIADACRAAYAYVQGAIAAGAAYCIGHGHGPVNHFWNWNI